MTLKPTDRAAFERHVTAIRKLLQCDQFPTMQLRLNVNEHRPQSFEVKLHERITVDAPAMIGVGLTSR